MSPSSTTVLVIDDEPPIRRFIKATLDTQGWATIEADSAAEGLRIVRHHHPDLVLLDLGLPDRDGMDLIDELRALGDSPILVLTARGDEASKVLALDRGADDYVTKPFGMPELLARMRAALRHRIQAQGGRAKVEAGDIVIDLAYRRVSRAGNELHLSPKAWDILAELATHAGKVLTHRHLLTKVWGRASETEQQYLRVYIRQLRQKLEQDPDRPELIVTEPGVGYRLLAEV
jgi:two-component system KDP operon response regulator KdpE